MREMETKMRMNDMMQLAIAREWNVQTERIIKSYISYTDACIADLEAQNAKLLALVREVASGTMWNITDHCMFCGCRSDDTHTEDCLLKRAQALLTELDTKCETE
jgi:hypothetical protein